MKQQIKTIRLTRKQTLALETGAVDEAADVMGDYNRQAVALGGTVDVLSADGKLMAIISSGLNQVREKRWWE